MDSTFTFLTTLYFASISAAIHFNPWAILVTAVLFITLPTVSDVELIPGMETSLEAQIEILKTQYWLSKNGYHESI